MLQGKFQQLAHPRVPQLAIIKFVPGELPRANALIPIAAQQHLAPRQRPIHCLRGIGALAHHIPQTPDIFYAPAAQILIQRLHGGQIAVQIGHQRNFRHASS